MTRYFVALGANLFEPDEVPLARMHAAVDLVGARTGRVTGVSRWYATPAFPAGAGPDYINGALSLDSGLTPVELLAKLHDIEAEFGRIRGERWASRRMDVDLLAAGDTLLPDAVTHARWRDLPLEQQVQLFPDRLILPHPRLQERAFVLGPLLDIAPDWRHPVLGVTVTQMWLALPEAERADVRLWDAV